MLVFLALNTLGILWRVGRIELWLLLLCVNLASAALVALMARAPDTKLIAFLSGAYPVFLTLAYYSQLGIVSLDVAFVQDHAVQEWEAALFGGQASLSWQPHAPNALLSWFLHLCYGSYYWLVALPPIFLFVARSREAFERSAFRIALAFYACYLIFMVFPVNGPRFFYGAAAGPAADVLPARLVHAILESGSSWGTAFPSSHVAASWMAVMSLWGESGRLLLVLAPVALGLALGTVYGGFHYGVDALAGAALSLALLAVARPLRRLLS